MHPTTTDEAMIIIDDYGPDEAPDPGVWARWQAFLERMERFGLSGRNDARGAEQRDARERAESAGKPGAAESPADARGDDGEPA